MKEESRTNISLEAGSDLSSSQHLFVAVASDGQVDVVGAAGAKADGILQNKPAAAGRAAVVTIGGVTNITLGDTVAAGASVASDGNGKAVTASTSTHKIMGTLLVGGDANEIVPMIFNPSGEVA
jgi:hypothetical protein